MSEVAGLCLCVHGKNMLSWEFHKLPCLKTAGSGCALSLWFGSQPILRGKTLKDATNSMADSHFRISAFQLRVS